MEMVARNDYGEVLGSAICVMKMNVEPKIA